MNVHVDKARQTIAPLRKFGDGAGLTMCKDELLLRRVIARNHARDDTVSINLYEGVLEVFEFTIRGGVEE